MNNLKSMSDRTTPPQKNKYRAMRRKLLVRTKARAKKLMRISGWSEESTVKLAEHLQFCSCEGCRNPRDGNSHHDKTRQELKAELKEHEE